MDTQTEPASQSLGGYPSSASGGISLPGITEGLRTGSFQDVPEAIVNPTSVMPPRQREVMEEVKPQRVDVQYVPPEAKTVYPPRHVEVPVVVGMIVGTFIVATILVVLLTWGLGLLG